jgi:hypothetical protein
VVTIGSMRLGLPLIGWLTAPAAWLLAPAVASAQQAAAEEPNLFECSACVGFRTLPYWGPVVGGILLATAFFLFVYQKPFPTLPEEDPDGGARDEPGHVAGS